MAASSLVGAGLGDDLTSLEFRQCVKSLWKNRVRYEARRCEDVEVALLLFREDVLDRDDELANELLQVVGIGLGGQVFALEAHLLEHEVGTAQVAAFGAIVVPLLTHFIGGS